MTDKKPVPPSLAQFALEQLAEAGEPTTTSRAEELIADLEVEIVKRDVRIAELEDHLDASANWDAEQLVVIHGLNAELAELKAQQPSAGVVLPERMVFSYKHKDGSQAAVTVTRSEVLDKMGDHIHEELIGKFCQCQSVGETNVVECNCEDYAAGFELVSDEVARLNPCRAQSVPEGYVLVPVEPTARMQEAGCRGYLGALGTAGVMYPSMMGRAYKDMLAAAPSAKKESGQ